MKHLTILILALLPFISSCNKDSDTDFNLEIREIAWNSLSEQEKSTVVVRWEKAPITETTYQEKNCYAVSFSTSDDALLGPFVVYIDKTSLIVLGHGLRM